MSLRRPDLLGMHHLAMKTPHYAELREFYVEVIGMQVEWEPDAENVYLTSGSDNLAIHYTREIPDVNQILDHVGFIVARPEDVDRWHDYLSEQDVPILASPRTHRDGARSLYCLDPAGTQIQIIYHPPLSDASQGN